MPRVRRLVTPAIAFLVSASAMLAERPSDPPLPGDRVPDLGDSVVWSHGEPAPSFEPGTVYVLDFWATWCPPCYPMIDQLSALVRDPSNDRLAIIGLTIGSDLGMPLARFLEREGDRIDYAIALPRDEDELKAALVHPVLNPADDFQLPHLMIVDRDGRLGWVSELGNPERGFEEALESILSGAWDLDAEATRVRKMVEATAGSEGRLQAVRRHREAGRLDQASEILAPLVAENPALFAGEAVDLFRQMLCSGMESSAYAFGDELLGAGLEERVAELLRLQRAITMTPGVEHRDFALAAKAVAAAQRAKADQDPDLVYELAKIAWLEGDAERAGALQAEAVRLAERVGRDARYLHTIRDLPIQQIIDFQAQQIPCPPGGVR